ncbi:hypothetical protein DD769_06515 [Helicobacter pylori]|nr:hypothetical protein DD769_06515 [Helicobacter pylori]
MGSLFLRGFSGFWSLGFIFLSLIFILSFISCLFWLLRLNFTCYFLGFNFLFLTYCVLILMF